MFYLYIKTHNKTGLNYLGQTERDPFVYKGSGTHWKRHIKKHGYDVTTVLLYKTLYKEEIRDLGLYYSEVWNVVESKEFANMVKEEGTGGGIENMKTRFSGKTHTQESKDKISAAGKGRKDSKETIEKRRKSLTGKKRSQESKNKMREAQKGKKRSQESIDKQKITMTGQKKTEEHRKNISIARRGCKMKTSECPHCKKIGSVSNMIRWHFDNCKMK